MIPERDLFRPRLRCSPSTELKAAHDLDAAIGQREEYEAVQKRIGSAGGGGGGGGDLLP
jgi:hypothetical protein